MPAASFYHLSDADLGRLIAFLRRQPHEDGHDVATRIGPLGRLGLVTGRFATAPVAMDHGLPRLPPGADGDLTARGRYLAQVACSECHGQAFEGGLDGRAPPLAIAYAILADQSRVITGLPQQHRITLLQLLTP